MALRDELFIATFNGIPFYIDTSQMTQGRKTVVHEYPNKKYRYVEDLGENLRSFTVTGIVSGDLYLVQREALILALQHKGIGILTHPFYGMVYVVVLNYTVSEDIKTLGECIFNITFTEAKENIFPISGEETIASIEGLENELLPYLSAGFITAFTTIFKKNITDSANKCSKLNSSLQPNKPVTTEQEALNNFKSNSDAFNANKYNLIQNPDNFQQAITGLLNSYNDLGATDNDSYLLNSNSFYFGSDDVPIKQTTVELKEKARNRLTINCFVNATLLMNLYKNASSINYLDENQLSNISNDLENKYQYLMLNNNFDRDTLLRLEKIRIAIKKFFDLVKVNVNKITTVSINSTPLTVLLYNYEEGFEFEDEIISLNNLYNVFNIQGNIKVLTS